MYLLLAIAAALALAGLYARNQWLRQRALERVAVDREADEPEPPAERPPIRSALRRYWPVPWLFALSVVLVLHYVIDLKWMFAVAIGFVAGTIAALLESNVAVRASGKYDSQLVEAIDLMIAALHAGVGVNEALVVAARETPRPLGPELETMVTRLRLGENPKMVLEDLKRRIPLETYSLFCSALEVHWEVGGSLAPTLATVSRTIRDRIDLKRRVQAQSTQARASVVAVVVLTYLLFLIIWRSAPERMEDFINTSLGTNMVSGTIMLQCFGLLWIAGMSKAEI